MRAKRFFYSLLLVLFSLVLVADLGLWFLVPDAAAASEGETGFSFTPPEGMSFPEGVTPPEGGSFPEGMTLPDGMTPPEGGSFSEGGTFPESSETGEASARRRPSRSSAEGETQGAEASAESADALAESESSSRRRPSRTGSSSDTQAEGAAEVAEASPLKDWFSAKVAELRQYLPLSELTPVKELVQPYRLYILIGAALGMVLCILRLIFLGRKIRKAQEAQESAASLRRVALWPAFLLLLGALALVVFLFPVNEEEQAEDGAVTNAQVLSGKVEEKDLTSLIQSTGALEEQEAVTVEIPASVSIESVCVRNGDTVTAGQIVAKADKTSVMKAVASVHEALDQIDGQLQEAHEAKGETSLTAPVAGTVKVVYAQVGEAALDVMGDHGSLMLLSLDGRMAVQVPTTDDLIIGSAVSVTLPDGTELAAEVAFLEEGIATVTVVDRGYAIGTEVSVKDGAGALLGSGPLYVHKALNITGYLGTVTRIYRQEGSTITAGAALIGLSDTADLAQYGSLLQQRADYEAELKTLFELYEDGYIHAPCDGAIEGLDEELPYASLADMVTGLTARHVATGPADAEPSEYVHYVGEVLGNENGLLSLRVSSSPVNVSSYTSLPSLPSSTMAGTYTIPGSVPIYLFSGGWHTISVANILMGDKILFTFDMNGSLVWVIVAHTSASATPSPTPSPTPRPTPTPAPDGSPGPSGSPGPDGTPSPSGGPGGGGHGGGGRISFGRGGAKTTPKPLYVIAKKELCTVTPQERMLITVSIDELDVLALTLGQTADLYLDALPITGLTATVTKIDPEGENNGGNTKYAVTLALERSEQLYPGMNGTVCFPRREGKAVLTVPLVAVTEEGDRMLVYTAYNEETDELLSPVTVQTGVSDGTDVEIISGLALGDTYYYRYADAISYVTGETEG